MREKTEKQFHHLPVYMLNYQSAMHKHRRFMVQIGLFPNPSADNISSAHESGCRNEIVPRFAVGRPSLSPIVPRRESGAGFGTGIHNRCLHH
jgi:hypothetical protein